MTPGTAGTFVLRSMHLGLLFLVNRPVPRGSRWQIGRHPYLTFTLRF